MKTKNPPHIQDRGERQTHTASDAPACRLYATLSCRDYVEDFLYSIAEVRWIAGGCEPCIKQ